MGLRVRRFSDNKPFSGRCFWRFHIIKLAMYDLSAIIVMLDTIAIGSMVLLSIFNPDINSSKILVRDS